MSLERTIDALLEVDAVLFGSLPPEARDLDLVVDGNDLARVEARLEAEGFTRRGHRWARFRGCEAEALELFSPAALHLPRSLLRDSSPLPGTARLRRPAPHHALLLLARRHAHTRGALRRAHRDRIDEELRRDPAAWERAAGEASAWGGRRSISLLRAAHERDEIAQVGERRRAVAEEVEARGRMRVLAWASSWRETARRARRPGVVIALSGLDGSGKSSLAGALQRSVGALGRDAVIVWTRFGERPRLDAAARRLKRALGRGASSPGADPEEAGRRLRRSSGWASAAWVALLALETAMERRRRVREHLRRGRVVICDRYTLDSYVRIRYRYGGAGGYRAARWLLRALPPEPARAYWLAVDPAVAMARKREHYAPEQLALQDALYAEEHPALGVRRLDGARPAEELCAEIASDVWRLL